MRKNIGYIAIAYFIFRAPTLYLLTSSLASNTKQDMWISILLGIIVGLFPIFLYRNIAKKNKKSNILINGSKLFPNNIFKYILGLFSLLYTLIILLNITTFIHNQYLDKTPSIIITISLLLPVTFLLNQKEKIIPRVAFVLSLISIIFILTSIIGLTYKLDLGNISPLMENNPLKGIIPFLSYCVLPAYTLLIFPNNKIKDSILTGYIISSITIFISIFYLISCMGINLILLYKYPEMQTLKEAFGSTLYIRLANFLSLQWILDSFIFITVGLKFSNKAFNINNNYMLSIILSIIISYLSKETFILNMITKKYYSYIALCIFIITIIYKKRIIKRKST